MVRRSEPLQRWLRRAVVKAIRCSIFAPHEETLHNGYSTLLLCGQ